MKRIISLGAVLSILLILPGSVQAQGFSEREAFFCSSHPERQTGISDMFNKKIELYQTALSNQSEQQVARRMQLDEKLTSARAVADMARNESYLLIKNKQTTEEDKTLAEAYAAEVDQAIAARRAEYDTVRLTFHQTIDNLLRNRAAAIQASSRTFQEESAAAMQRVASDCKSSRADKQAARRQFIEDMRSARLKYAEQLRLRKDFKAEVKDAIAIRDEAFKTATTRFQQTMQNIREKYRPLKD